MVEYVGLFAEWRRHLYGWFCRLRVKWQRGLSECQHGEHPQFQYDRQYFAVRAFPNGSYNATSNPGGRLYTGSFNEIPPIPMFGWARSPDYNGMYFDPSQTYTPWVSDGTTTFSNASPTAAVTDPTASGATTFDLTSYVVSSGSVSTTSLSTACSGISGTSGATAATTNWGFTVFGFTNSKGVFEGMTIPTGTCVLVNKKTATKYGYTSTPTWVYLTNDVRVGTSDQAISGDSYSTITSGQDLYIAYFPATFYLKTTTSLPSDFGYTGTVLTGYQPDGVTTMNGYEIKPANFVDTAHYQKAIQNFANWFVYYRKRYQAIRAGMGAAFHPITGMRVASFTIDNSSGGSWSSNLSMLDLGSAKFHHAVHGWLFGPLYIDRSEHWRCQWQQLRRSEQVFAALFGQHRRHHGRRDHV
jgi:type IV pilus assembly protein PilY1